MVPRYFWPGCMFFIFALSATRVCMRSMNDRHDTCHRYKDSSAGLFLLSCLLTCIRFSYPQYPSFQQYMSWMMTQYTRQYIPTVSIFNTIPSSHKHPHENNRHFVLILYMRDYLTDWLIADPSDTPPGIDALLHQGTGAAAGVPGSATSTSAAESGPVR